MNDTHTGCVVSSSPDVVIRSFAAPAGTQLPAVNPFPPSDVTFVTSLAPFDVITAPLMRSVIDVTFVPASTRLPAFEKSHQWTALSRPIGEGTSPGSST